MSEIDLQARLEAAMRVAREAGALALDYFRRRDELPIEHKGRQDLVSIADRDVETLIRRELGAAFPDDAFIGEEHGGEVAARAWVIDPIDGTLNFLRGIPIWSVVIAYVIDERTELGITYDPVHDELFTAQRGHGAKRNGTAIRVSGATEPGESLVSFTFSFRAPGNFMGMMESLIEQGFEHRRLGSTAIKLCYVADGRNDALITQACSSWDAIAGLLTVTEAGGLASDFIGRYGLLGRGGVIAATPGLKAQIERASGLGFD